jgi:hypothetical protein
MNNMYSFNPDEKRQRMAQALENYILPEQKLQMPQTPAQSSSGMSPMDIAKLFKKKPINPYSSNDAKDASTPTDLNVYQESQ